MDLRKCRLRTYFFENVVKYRAYLTEPTNDCLTVQTGHFNYNITEILQTKWTFIPHFQ